jgi:myotubularin-related protein 5/13
MFFSSFIQERGPPFRPCDLFDDLYADLDRTLEDEHRSPELVISHIKEIANKLLMNESIDEEIETLNKWKPSASIGSRTFPVLDAQVITGIIESEQIREEMEGNKDEGDGNEKIAPKLVAIGPTSSLIADVNSSITNSARRLEVMKNCIQCIFEDRILDAKKTFPAVLRTLKNNTARLALAQELSHYVSGAKAILRHDQFDLVVRLMNCALQQDCDDLGNSAAGLSGYEDVNGVAAAIIPLSMAFCRKLHTHVIQFAYTCVQGHAIWNNQSFWESSFYQNVSKDISALYSSKHRLVNHLEVVAEQMRLIYEGKVDGDAISENEKNEIRTLFSQVVHFSNTIIALKIPLDVGTMDKTSRHLNPSGEGHSDTTSNATGNAGRESWRDDEREPRDDESGFEEDKSGSQGRGAKNEIQENVIKFITRFQDKVCSEGELSEDDIRRLHSLIPGLVQMQADTLDQVYKESRKLPPVSKPKIMLPDLLPGEEVTVLSGLRVYLIPDGRDENYAPRNASNCAPGVGPVLLPAEGAIFLTNYRIIFRGRPCDPFYAESSVVRSFPIATLTKEKRINIPSNHFVAAIDHMISEGLQLRSNAFQLLTIAFDEEVTPDSIEMFKKMVNKARSPADIFTLFAFTSQVTTATQYKYLNQQKQKDKGSTFKNVGKKTLRRAAAMTGFQSKSKNKSHKYLVQSLQSGTPRKLSPTDSFDENSLDNVSFTSEARSVTTLPPSQFSSPLHMAAAGSLKEKDTRELQKLCDLLYVKDYQRLRLGSAKDLLPAPSTKPHSKTQPMPSDSFKITCVNSGYAVVSSYPSFLVIPRIISDESVKKFARGYRQGRFPVITWKHKKGGLLLRGSSFHGKGVIGLFRGHANQGSQAMSDSTLSVEQEKYLKTMIALTPSHFIRPRDSVSKLRGLQEEESGRKHSYSSTLSKAMNTLRTSGGKGTIGSFGSSVSKQIQRLNHGMREGHETRVTPSSPEKYSHQNKTSLYIIGEKNQIRGVKSDHFPNCEFIPADVHDAKNVKQSFKKLMRACCPSLPSNDSDVSFFKEIRASEWYQQLQTIMQLSSTVVDIIDEEECSVMICLEDGWDLVPQITSIAQLCLDPFYRTFRGFRTLIEKEWLAFGHRFTHRSNHIAATLTSGFAPIFLQFLDIVHQIMNQFALSFEFNNYFLKFLAYHYVSCRFRTFLLDSENERAELGWLMEDLKRSNDAGNDLEFDDDASISGHSFSAPLSDKFNYIGTSFWTYAEAAWSKTSLFYNFLYEPTNESDDKVLRPSCNQCLLTVWDYYCEESLAHGFSYDLELVKMEKQRREEVAATEHSSTQRKKSRKVCNALSECIPDAQPSSLAQLLDQVRKLEQMVGYNCNPSWSSIWNKVEIPLLSTTGLSRNAQAESFDSLAQLTGLSGCQAMSSLSQKRLASSISVRSRFANLADAGSNQFVYSHRPHRFEKCAFTKPTNCEACRNVLWGFAKTDMKCSDCNFSCHSKCADQASNNCPGFGASKKLMPLVPDSQPKIPPPVPPPPAMSQNGQQRKTVPIVTTNSIPEESSAMTLTRSDTYFDEFSHPERAADNITFQGYLNKRGALLKNWKQRWFVLDSIKHQVSSLSC